MLSLLQIRRWKVFAIFGIDVSCLSYRYILFSVIGPRFPDYSSFSRVKGSKVLAEYLPGQTLWVCRGYMAWAPRKSGITYWSKAMTLAEKIQHFGHNERQVEGIGK